MMGSFITYGIQQALPAKLEILHTRVQNSDEQFAPHCGANLKRQSGRRCLPNHKNELVRRCLTD